MNSNPEMNDDYDAPTRPAPAASVLVIGPAQEHQWSPSGALIPKRLMINLLNTCDALKECLHVIFNVSPATHTEVRMMHSNTHVDDTNYDVLIGSESLQDVGVANGRLIQLYLL